MDTIWYTVNVDKRNGPSGVATTPRGPDQREATLWPRPLSRTQRENPQAKKKKLGAPAADSGSRAASFSRSDRRRLLGVSQSARTRRCVGLALVDIGCFDALRVCNVLLGGGAGVRRANGPVAASFQRLLSQFLASSIHRAAEKEGILGN